MRDRRRARRARHQLAAQRPLAGRGAVTTGLRFGAARLTHARDARHPGVAREARAADRPARTASRWTGHIGRKLAKPILAGEAITAVVRSRAARLVRRAAHVALAAQPATAIGGQHARVAASSRFDAAHVAAAAAQAELADAPGAARAARPAAGPARWHGAIGDATVHRAAIGRRARIARARRKYHCDKNCRSARKRHRRPWLSSR